MTPPAPTARLWYLPPGVEAPPNMCEGGVDRPACVDDHMVRASVRALATARPHIAALGIDEIVTAVDGALHRWRQPKDRFRRALLAHGPALTGYSRPALEHVLDVMLARFDANGLRLLLSEEFGDPYALDRFVPSGSGTSRTALGPGLQFQVLAGSVPTVPIFSMICALLLKSPVLLKPASSDPLFPALFAQTLASVEPRLAEAMAVLPWPGGSVELESIALDAAGAVVVYGSDSTVEQFRGRVPVGKRFLGYGHRLSVAGVAREVLGAERVAETARRLAWDVALFDQRGCLSPQVALVERGGATEPAELAALVAHELETLSDTLPRGTLSPDQTVAIQSLRELAQFRAAMDSRTRIWQSRDSTAWTVLYQTQPERLAGYSDRVLLVTPVDGLETDLPRLTAGLPLSTIGLAADERRLPGLATALAACATRICPLGTMGEPPVTWRHDGRPNLADLVTWVDLEGVR